MSQTNKKIIFLERPKGPIIPEKQFRLESSPVTLPSKGSNEVLVRVTAFSLDPAMRGWMSDAKSYVPPVPIGDVMRALAVGVVVASENPSFKSVRCFLARV